jgi:hypothetical protein
MGISRGIFCENNRRLISADNNRALQPIIYVDMWGVQLSYKGGCSYPIEGDTVIQMGGVYINPLI